MDEQRDEGQEPNRRNIFTEQGQEAQSAPSPQEPKAPRAPATPSLPQNRPIPCMPPRDPGASRPIVAPGSLARGRAPNSPAQHSLTIKI